jgi:hypothetical protein
VQHFGRETRSAHPEQHHVCESRLLDRTGKRAQASKLGSHEIKDVEPAEAIRDLCLDLGIARPDVKALRPERVGEPNWPTVRPDRIELTETLNIGGECGCERAGIDHEGRHSDY